MSFLKTATQYEEGSATLAELLLAIATDYLERQAIHPNDCATCGSDLRQRTGSDGRLRATLQAIAEIAYEGGPDGRADRLTMISRYAAAALGERR